MFDTIVYPELKSKNKNIVTKTIKALKDWAFGSNDIYQPEIMRQHCLLTFLEETKCSFMQHCLLPSYSVQKMVNHILNILQCLLIQRICHDYKPDVWKDDSLATVSVTIFSYSVVICEHLTLIMHNLYLN